MTYDPETIDKLIQTNESLVRAVQGNPREGNPGLIQRVTTLEVEHRRFRWTVPFALFGGSSVGAVLTKVLGI